jgi:hypothetical protein
VKYHFNARWYDADTARFVSEDPARDGVNWYVYVANNPIRYMDPTGLRILTLLESILQKQNTGRNRTARMSSVARQYFYQRSGRLVPNTLQYGGCLFVACVNIGNTIRDEIAHGYTAPIMASDISENDRYWTAGSVELHEFIWEAGNTKISSQGTFMTSTDVEQLLFDMTGIEIHAERITNREEALRTISRFADDEDFDAYILGVFITDSGSLHFVPLGADADDDGIFQVVYDPFEYSAPQTYSIENLIGAYTIEEQDQFEERIRQWQLNDARDEMQNLSRERGLVR